jgi:hypothetical protein
LQKHFRCCICEIILQLEVTLDNNVFRLFDPPPQPSKIAQAVRIGFSEHLQAEHLIGSNKLTARRFVIEAAHAARHAHLLQTLRDAGAEIVLDTNVAELSVPGRFSGSMKDAPWAVDGRMLEIDDVVAGTNKSVIEPIARFAVKEGFTAVQAPAHFLGDERMDWLPADLRAAEALRVALDREGGSHITVDYPLIASYAQLRNPKFRKRVKDGLASMPDGYLWIRTSGFGGNATATGITRYIEAVHSFHELDRPIMADQVGGLAAMSACAFGATSGYATGIESKQKFDASSWLKTDKRGGRGGGKRVYLPGLDRTLTIEDARAMFNEARTSRQFLGCNDPSCCGSIEKMLANPEAHRIVQEARAIETLSNVPESNRTDEFRKFVEQRRQEAQRSTRLKNASEELRKTLAGSAKRLELIEDQLKGLHERTGQPNFALEAQLRVNQGPDNPGGSEGRTGRQS